MPSRVKSKNAFRVHNIPVDNTNLTDGYVLQYNATSGQLEYTNPSALSVTDILVKVSVDDTTPDFLLPKLFAGHAITLTENNPGGNENVGIAVDEAAIDHTAISNIGSNSHATIDSHLSSTANPHTVTAAQVGNTTAQWNADQLQGADLDVGVGSPADMDVLVYNTTSSKWEAVPAAGSAARITYQVSVVDINCNNTSFLSVGQMHWDDSRYSGYTTPACVLAATASSNRDLEIRVFDIITATQLGITTIAQGAGFTATNFSFTKPTADTLLDVQCRKVSAGGNNPTFHAASLEFGA